MQIAVRHRFQGAVRQFLIALVVCVLLLLLERVGLSNSFRAAALRVFQPFELFGMTTLTAVEFPLRWITRQKTSAEEVQNLRRSYSQALAQLSELEAVKKENETLRAMIEKETKPIEKKILAAPIISYSLTAIAKGVDDGVGEGALIYVNDTLVGRVTAVEKIQSQVTLFTHPESLKILVKTQNNVQGLLVGTGKKLEVTQLPTQAVVGTGDRVTTVGQPGIPPDQLVGVVTGVSQAQTAPTQTAVLDELNSFYSASLVEVR